MIKAISPAERETFKDALISLFDEGDIPLLASAEPEPEPEPSDNENNPPNGNGHNGNGHGHIDVESFEIGVSDLTASLNKMGINDLRKLAKKHRLDSKGAKFILIHRLIESGISEADLVAS
jgi:hypothetical protein